MKDDCTADVDCIDGDEDEENVDVQVYKRRFNALLSSCLDPIALIRFAKDKDGAVDGTATAATASAVINEDLEILFANSALEEALLGSTTTKSLTTAGKNTLLRDALFPKQYPYEHNESLKSKKRKLVVDETTSLLEEKPDEPASSSSSTSTDKVDHKYGERHYIINHIGDIDSENPAFERAAFGCMPDDVQSDFVGRLVWTGNTNEALMILTPKLRQEQNEEKESKGGSTLSHLEKEDASVVTSATMTTLTSTTVSTVDKVVATDDAEEYGHTDHRTTPFNETVVDMHVKHDKLDQYNQNDRKQSGRSQMEEALRQSEERHRKLFESMVQGVVYQDAETGGIVAANPSAERILGLTVDQMMGRSSVDPRWKSVHEDGSDYPGDTHPSMVAIKTGRAVTNAIMGVFHPLSDSLHWISIDAVPMFKPGSDRPFQVYTTFTDITEQRRAQQEIVSAKEKAEEADKLKSAFLANMSHEIRTPLNGIMGHIDLALSNGLDVSHQAENLDGLYVARESGHLLLAIINDILDLSKMEAGQMDIDTSKAFSLSKMVAQTLRLANMLVDQRNGPKKDIRVINTVDEQVSPYIYGDNFRVQQIINNLVSNAVKFTDQGSVELGVQLVSPTLSSVKTEIDADDTTSSGGRSEPSKPRMLEFSVRDTGRGIPMKQLEVIFEPFRQVDFSDTRKFGGTGLGLTISKHLVELMQGSIWVESKFGIGSSFYFTIPYRPALLDDIDAAAAETERIQIHEENHTVRKSPKWISPEYVTGKILIAEDDPISRKLAMKMVSKAGYEVVLAENGKEAVEKFASDKTIDLILMDVQMCVMGGLEATIKIRQLEEETKATRPIPIIALSAAAMNSDREKGALAGMTDYLTKPVHRQSLLETLEKYTQR